MYASTYTLHLCLGCRVGTFHFFKPGKKCVIEVCRTCGEEQKIAVRDTGFFAVRRLAKQWNQTYAPQFFNRAS